MYRKNVTMIDDLPELEEGMPKPPMQAQDQRPQDMKFVQKFLRDTSNKGMGKYEEHQQQIQQQMQQYPIQNPLKNNLINLPMERPTLNIYSQEGEIIEPPTQKSFITCVEVMQHIKECPVCTKIYKDNDKSLYIVVIVILGLVCLILMKRIFEK